MAPIFQYQESLTLRLIAPVILIICGAFIMTLVRGGWSVGFAIVIIGLGGVLYGLCRKAPFLSISSEEVISHEGKVLINQVRNVSRRNINEAIFYDFEMKGGFNLLVKAPYIPSQEKRAWAALERSINGVSASGVSPK
jgi:hypothetical protein